MSSDNISFTKIIYALTEVLTNLHKDSARNIHAYHKIYNNTNIPPKNFYYNHYLIDNIFIDRRGNRAGLLI